MASQLTFLNNKAVAAEYHRTDGEVLAHPDENYSREILQLHSIGLTKMNDDGTPVRDEFGNLVDNYTQRNIFTSAKVKPLYFLSPCCYILLRLMFTAFRFGRVSLSHLGEAIMRTWTGP